MVRRSMPPHSQPCCVPLEECADNIGSPRSDCNNVGPVTKLGAATSGICMPAYCGAPIIMRSLLLKKPVYRVGSAMKRRLEYGNCQLLMCQVRGLRLLSHDFLAWLMGLKAIDSFADSELNVLWNSDLKRLNTSLLGI